MSAYQFGWLTKQDTIDTKSLVRDLNTRLRSLVHDFESGTIALTTRATEFKYPITITSTTSPQWTLKYDASNYLTLGISSAGLATFTLVGTTASMLVNNGSDTDAFRVRSAGARQGAFEYDGSNYMTITVSSAGAVTFDAVGASAGFTFSDAVAVSAAFNVSSGTARSAGLFGTNASQVEIGYDGSNYYKTSVSSTGAVTFDAVGASAGFTFSDAVTVSALLTINSGTAQAIVATSTNSDQVQVRYDGSNYFTASVSSAGAVTFNAVGSGAGFTFSDAVTVSALGGLTFTGSSGIINSTGSDKDIRLQLDGTDEFIIGKAASGGSTRSITIFSTGTLPSSGDKFILLGNATTAPSTNPSGGGVLYCESGALKYRGSSGTTTTLGAA